jgi:predicted RNase H-like nuclease (RuvC/YqgF family)
MHVTRTDAQNEEVQKQESRQELLHAVVQELKKEHTRIWKESDEAKDKIANAANENRSLRQQLSTAEKELQKTVADRDTLATERGTSLRCSRAIAVHVPAA